MRCRLNVAISLTLALACRAGDGGTDDVGAASTGATGTGTPTDATADPTASTLAMTTTGSDPGSSTFGATTSDSGSSTDTSASRCSDGRQTPGELCFVASEEIDLGDNASGLDIGDLDGDTRTDLVVARSEADEIVFVYGSAGGGFDAPILRDVYNTSEAVAMGDFDANGIMDVAVARHVGPEALLLLGAGDRTFVDALLLPGFQSNVAVGRIDGDDVDDVVFGHLTTAYVVLGDPAGVFPDAEMVPGIGNEALALAHTDQDGNLDLVTCWSLPGKVGVAPGDGNGGFGPVSEFARDGFPFDLAVVDLDADGDADLVVAQGSNHGVAVLLGDGRGGFALAGIHPLTTGTEPWAVDVGDLDGDGYPDVVTAGFYTSVLTVFLGDGAGGLGAPIEIAELGNVRDIFVHDIDLDGDLDIAVANSRYVTVFYSEP